MKDDPGTSRSRAAQSPNRCIYPPLPRPQSSASGHPGACRPQCSDTGRTDRARAKGQLPGEPGVASFFALLSERRDSEPAPQLAIFLQLALGPDWSFSFLLLVTEQLCGSCSFQVPQRGEKRGGGLRPCDPSWMNGNNSYWIKLRFLFCNLTPVAV